MGTIEPLGGVFIPVGDGSGSHIKMRYGEAVTLVSYVAAGNQQVTLKESIDGASEQNLAVIDTIWKGPGVGGTWTEVTQTAAATYTNADATNDCIVITVFADQLSPTFNCVEFTVVNSLWSHVLLHSLRNAQDPANLPNIVA